MARLADAARREYEPHARVMWRPAPDAVKVHGPWLTDLVAADDVGTFVHEGTDGGIDGFVVITLTPAPPVYDPGGLSSHIDDFVVAPPARWPSVGAALLGAATDWARARGAVQVVAVCGAHDGPKRDLLRDAGLAVASEWFAAPLSRADQPRPVSRK